MEALLLILLSFDFLRDLLGSMWGILIPMLFSALILWPIASARKKKPGAELRKANLINPQYTSLGKKEKVYSIVCVIASLAMLIHIFSPFPIFRKLYHDSVLMPFVSSSIVAFIPWIIHIFYSKTAYSAANDCLDGIYRATETVAMLFLWTISQSLIHYVYLSTNNYCWWIIYVSLTSFGLYILFRHSFETTKLPWKKKSSTWSYSTASDVPEDRKRIVFYSSTFWICCLNCLSVICQLFVRKSYSYQYYSLCYKLIYVSFAGSIILCMIPVVKYCVYAIKEWKEKEKQYISACEQMNDISSSTDALAAYASFETILEYKDAGERAEKCLALEEKYRKKEQSYEDACLALNNAKTIKDAQTAYEKFAKLKKYRDSRKKAKQCLQLEKEYQNKEKKYRFAQDKFDTAESVADFEEARELFADLSGYRDAADLVASCNEQIQKTLARIDTAYRDACLALNNAKVAKDARVAYDKFVALKNYKDSVQKAKQCLQLEKEYQEKENIYQNALTRLARAKSVAEYEAVSKLFAAISGYRNSDNLVETCNEQIKGILDKIDAPYRDACLALNNSKVAEDAKAAYDKFVALNDYKDSKQKAEQCLQLEKEYQEKEKKYQKALVKYNEAKSAANFETAGKQFAAISGYRDSDSLASICNEKATHLKKIENEARKEAARKKRLEEEQKAKIEAINNALTAPDDIAVTKENITFTNRKALNLFLDNPFRILGLSRNASIEDAQAVLDKLKKLERLKALGSYSSPFHLRHFAKPDRSAAVVQAAIGTLNDTNNRILWFSTAVGCAAWFVPAYRDLYEELPGIVFDKYDVFLANYIFGLLNDPLFEDKAMWTKIFSQMIDFIKQGDRIAALFDRADKETGFGAIFEKRISQPIVSMIEDAEIRSLKNLYVIIKDMDNLETISKALDSHLSKWFAAATQTIDKETSELGEGENATPEKIDKAKQLYEQLKSTVKPELTWAENNYPAKSVRLTMFRDKYRGTAWSLMGFLFLAGAKTASKTIADDIEEYCNDEQKDTIKYVIREVPRPRPTPTPPPHDTYDLGFLIPPYGDRILFVEVDLRSIANVYLMEELDYNAYMSCNRFRYYGGRQTNTPVRIRIPYIGHWYVVIDNDGNSVSGIYSACRTREI